MSFKPAKPTISEATRDRLIDFGFITDETKVTALNYTIDDNQSLEVINFDNGKRLIMIAV